MLDKTHMPFITGVGDTMLLCRSAATWKACYQTHGRTRKFRTHMRSDVCECSPTAWFDGQWNLSLIAGGSKSDPRFHLYRYSGKSLDHIGKPQMVCQARSGYVYKDVIVHGETQDFVFVERNADKFALEILGALILRVAYRADEPHKMLISGQWPGAEVFTLQYDTKTDAQHLIVCDGKPAYKCTIYQDRVLYADRIGPGFEDRRICLAKETSLIPVGYATKHI